MGVVSEMLDFPNLITDSSEQIRVESPEKVLNIFYKNVDEPLMRINALNECIVNELQRHCNFFNLGIDIAVDQNGEPWLLEVNSRPSPVWLYAVARPREKCAKYGNHIIQHDETTQEKYEAMLTKINRDRLKAKIFTEQELFRKRSDV